MVERIQNIEDLKTAIQAILVKDYGDFKRKLVLYLNRFTEAQNLPKTQKLLFIQMIDRIQFHPVQDIESTRSWTLDQLKQIH
ncbi:hypothetical protein K2X05_13395 [bacterium]|nr:hypothetical protein [bacterium]